MNYPTKKKNMKYKKSGIVHIISRSRNHNHDSLCGHISIWHSGVNSYEMTNEEVTCKKCLQAAKTNETRERERTLAKLDVDVSEAKTFKTDDGQVFRAEDLSVYTVKQFKTSDGKSFDDEAEAFEHAKSLKEVATRIAFKKYVRDELFEDPTIKEEDDIVKSICDKLEYAFSDESYDLDDVSHMLWTLFDSHEEMIEKALKKFKTLKSG